MISNITKKLLGQLLVSFGSDLLGAPETAASPFPPTESDSGAPTPAQPPTAKRGRPPKAATPPPVEPAAEETETPTTDSTPTVEACRAAIKPLVEAGRGAEVKELIKKHGGENISTIPAENRAAFLTDIEAAGM